MRAKYDRKVVFESEKTMGKTWRHLEGVVEPELTLWLGQSRHVVVALPEVRDAPPSGQCPMVSASTQATLHTENSSSVNEFYSLAC